MFPDCIIAVSDGSKDLYEIFDPIPPAWVRTLLIIGSTPAWLRLTTSRWRARLGYIWQALAADFAKVGKKLTANVFSMTFLSVTPLCGNEATYAGWVISQQSDDLEVCNTNKHAARLKMMSGSNAMRCHSSRAIRARSYLPPPTRWSTSCTGLYHSWLKLYCARWTPIAKMSKHEATRCCGPNHIEKDRGKMILTTENAGVPSGLRGSSGAIAKASHIHWKRVSRHKRMVNILWAIWIQLWNLSNTHWYWQTKIHHGRFIHGAWIPRATILAFPEGAQIASQLTSRSFLLKQLFSLSPCYHSLNASTSCGGE